MADENPSRSEIVRYQTEDGWRRIRRFEGEVARKAGIRKFRMVAAAPGLASEATVRRFRIVRSEGSTA